MKSSIFIALFVFLVTLSCQHDAGDNKNSKNAVNDKIQKINEIVAKEQEESNKKKIAELFNFLPSPIEAMDVLGTSENNFQENLLLSKQQYTKYLTSASQSLNLGVYGADLAYIKMFNQKRYFDNYFQVIKYLAEELGIPGSFSEGTYQRIDAKLSDKKAALEQLIDAYRATDDYLRTNDRNTTAAYLITGGWVESLYIAISNESQSHTDQLLIRILEQKYTLNYIIALLESIDQTPITINLSSNLKLLRKKLAPVTIDYVNEQLQVDSAKYKAYYATHGQKDFNNIEINEIRETINSIRNYIVNL